MAIRPLVIRLVNDPVVRKKVLRGCRLQMFNLPDGTSDVPLRRPNDDPNTKRLNAGREVRFEIARLRRTGPQPTTLIAH